MNVVKIMGGLGNQLFQYSLGKYLERFDSVGYDVSYYESEINKNGDVPHRELVLPFFADNLVYADQGDRERINQWEYKKGSFYQNSWFFGDWQSPSFFKGADLGLKLKPEHISNEAIENAWKLREVNSVAVHVRRTDYANFGWMLDRSYYEAAFARAYRLIESPKFFVFSDEIEWCKEYLPPGNKILIHMDELSDFYLMTQCKHNIIANSTFSFWAAYLNENKDKVVIYPNNWLCTSNPCEGLDWEGV